MKVAILLPGYCDSPDYLHMMTFDKRLKKLGYIVERIDPCNLWTTGNSTNYSVTNYIKQVENVVESYKSKNPEEIILIGHSMGAFTSILVGSRSQDIDKIIALCPAADRKYTDEEWKKNKVRTSTRDLPNDPTKTRSFSIPYSFVEDGLQYSAAEDVKNINKPIMIFIALNDNVVLPYESEKVVTNANNPFVVRQPNMGHDFRKSQEQCDIVIKHIESFLKQ